MRPSPLVSIHNVSSPQFADDMVLTQHSALPFYAQIKDLLRAKILDGTFPPNQKLASESELMAHFGVSRITVRQALNELQNEGLIYRIHGKGTFVSKPKAFQDLTRLQGFGEAMSQLGHETFNRVLSIQHMAAPDQVAQQLHLTPGTMVTELQRLRFLNREPISLDITYVPHALGLRLAEEDLARRDIFLILEQDYGMALGHADLQIGSTQADDWLAEQLAVEAGAPVLFIERTTVNAAGQPIDYEHLYYRGDAFKYKVRVDRVAGHPKS